MTHNKFTTGENEQPGRPIRAAKAKGITKLSEIIKIQNEQERQMRLEDLQQRVSKRIKNENEEQRRGRIEYTQKEELERIQNENEEQRHEQLEDKRKQESERK